MPKTVNAEDMKAFEKTEKLGLVATVDESGDPRITLLTTIMAADEKTICVGKFSKGISKENMLKRPKSGFAVVSLKMDFWHGTVNWHNEVKTEGPEYVKYNNMQMWRFNTYFGIDTVFTGDLVEISEKEGLNLPGIAANACKIMLKKGSLKSDRKDEIMRPFGVKMFGNLTNPKFLSFINADGYPVIVPVVQAQAAGTDRVVFTAKPYEELCNGLEKGARVAVFAASMQMESILVQGTFSGFDKGIGFVDIDKVYNSMPPISGYIYPPEPYKEVKDFKI